MTTSCLRALWMMVWLQAAAMAQFIWKESTTPGPLALWNGYSTAYDAIRGQTVVFGGVAVTIPPGSTTAAWTLLADTREWNGNGAWQLRTPPTGPSARAGHSMAFDSIRGRTVLFGGGNNISGGPYPIDTWEWDGINWTSIGASLPPSGRRNHAMAFDSLRGKVVLFGGSWSNGVSTYELDDTWEWDGISWTAVSNSGPGPRSGCAMAFDSSRGRTVLFGGAGNAAIYGQTWEWDGSGWALRTSAGPAARTGAGMAFDSVRGKSVLSGGAGTTSPTDTWEWDGSSWTQVASNAPSTFAGMVYDSLRARMVLLQAVTTWEWYDPAPGTSVVYGSGCGSPALTLVPDVSSQPTIGTSAQALVSNAPSSLVFVAIGWSRTNAGPFQLPVPLDGYGMTGCQMLQSTDVLGQPTAATGPTSAAFSLPLPFQFSLIDVHVYLQAWAVAPGMNPANIIVSNGLDWLIGY